MCKRTTHDPLVRMFLDNYKINLLAVPRQRAACGEVYLRNGRRVSAGLSLGELVEPEVALPSVYEGEQLADLAGTFSNRVSANVGLKLLDGFFAALGAAAAVPSVRAGFERARTATMQFAFEAPTRDSIDAGTLASRLTGRRLRAGHPLVRPGNEYFVTIAVVRSRSITVAPEDASSHRVELGAQALEAVDATAGVERQVTESGQVRFRGEVPLAIGVELYDLGEDGGDGLIMQPQDPHDPVRAGKPRPFTPAFVAPDEEALLEIAA